MHQGDLEKSFPSKRVDNPNILIAALLFSTLYFPTASADTCINWRKQQTVRRNRKSISPDFTLTENAQKILKFFETLNITDNNSPIRYVCLFVCFCRSEIEDNKTYD